MNPSVFREYDIRGVAERDFTDDVRRAIWPRLRRPCSPTSGGATRHARPRLPPVVAALHAALHARARWRPGLDVIDVGDRARRRCCTSRSSTSRPTAASRSPAATTRADYNGFKIVRRARARSTARRSRRCAGASSARLPRRRRPGSADRRSTSSADYVDYIADNIRLGPRRIKVVVDARQRHRRAVAPAHPAARSAARSMPLYCELDGRFPNHHPDPTVPENLADLIARGARDRRRGGHRARRRRRPDRRGRRPGPHHLGRPADDRCSRATSCARARARPSSAR